jgi:hypothetical protein
VQRASIGRASGAQMELERQTQRTGDQAAHDIRACRSGDEMARRGAIDVWATNDRIWRIPLEKSEFHRSKCPLECASCFNCIGASFRWDIRCAVLISLD